MSGTATMRCARLGGLLAVALAAADGAAAEPVRIGLSATADPVTSGTWVWADAFAKRLGAAGIETRIYPNSSIGAEVVRTEQVLLGLLPVNVAGSQEVEMLSPLFKGLELPFLFDSNEQLMALLERTAFLDRVNRQTLEHGMRVVAFAYTGGMEGLFTVGRPVRRPEDLVNLRLRAVTSQQLDYFEAWGSAGTQVAWEEVPQALQTGIADGYLNPPIVAVMFGHSAQLDYFTDLRLSPSMRTVVVSEQWYANLDAGRKAAVDDAIRHASKVNREWSRTAAATGFERLRAAGIEVIRLTEAERDAFRERLVPLYATLVSDDVRREVERLLAGMAAPP